ncbi:MAG TPA: TonB-dependent receptor plug domain-containing protein, partial [Chthoniobacterales bacterium]
MTHKYRLRPISAILTGAAVLVAVVINQPLRAQQTTATTTEGITVTGEPLATPHPHDDTRPKLEHIMREVSGTQITVTKKATVIKLDKEPPVQNNNNQELFIKAPGLIVSEQQTPGQFNYSYRGLGNPQESEYALFLQDGLPLMAEWIGFPTLYYQPVPQSVYEIQFIRGGSSLLYGPEPAPAINFVMKRPLQGSGNSAYMEQSGGSDGFYNTYAAAQSASGPVELRLDMDHQHSDGQRDNGQYELLQSNAYIGYRIDEKQLIALDMHASRYDGGEPGRLNIFQFDADQNFSPTPYNHSWVDRVTLVLRYEIERGNWLFQAKAWYTHQDIDARTGANLGPANALFGTVRPTTTQFAYEGFDNGGVDLRARLKWGEGTIFRGSALTFGGVAYHGEAPFTRYTLNLGNSGSNFLFAPRGATSTIIPLEQERSADYQ